MLRSVEGGEDDGLGPEDHRGDGYAAGEDGEVGEGHRQEDGEIQREEWKLLTRRVLEVVQPPKLTDCSGDRQSRGAGRAGRHA